jgi:hypothetical protein
LQHFNAYGEDFLKSFPLPWQPLRHANTQHLPKEQFQSFGEYDSPVRAVKISKRISNVLLIKLQKG